MKTCGKCGANDRNNSGSCRPCQKERSRKWAEANPEKILQAMRKWRKINPEKVSACARSWQKANPQRAKVIALNWREANPDKVKTIEQNRRARVKGNGGNLSTNIIKTLLAQQNGKCACCGLGLDNGYHLDHIMPLALGGINDDSNVQLLTPKCNLSKGAKHPVDYMRSKGRLI